MALEEFPFLFRRSKKSVRDRERDGDRLHGRATNHEPIFTVHATGKDRLTTFFWLLLELGFVDAMPFFLLHVSLSFCLFFLSSSGSLFFSNLTHAWPPWERRHVPEKRIKIVWKLYRLYMDVKIDKMHRYFV